MKISLIICAKNEEKSIQTVIKSAKPYVNEIIVVDGCSIDNTAKYAKIQHVSVIKDNGLGKGAGIQTGIKAAKGSIIVFMDADESHDPNDIPFLVKPIIQNKADLVIASRGKGGSDELSGSFEKNIRMLGSLIITSIINLRFNNKITDSQNGFRAIKKSVAKSINLTENGFPIEQEMVIKTLKQGYIILEIPSHEYARKYGISRICLKTMSLKYLWSIVKNIL